MPRHKRFHADLSLCLWARVNFVRLPCPFGKPPGVAKEVVNTLAIFARTLASREDTRVRPGGRSGSKIRIRPSCLAAIGGLDKKTPVGRGCIYRLNAAILPALGVAQYAAQTSINLRRLSNRSPRR